MNLSRRFLLAVTLLATHPVAFGDERAGAGVEFFETRIRPVLIRHCYECHSAASPELKGGLRLDSRDFIRTGGESGPAVVPGHIAKSLLLEAMRHESLEMPPGNRLPDRVIADFATWIEIGAPDPRDTPPSAEGVAELAWQTILNERRRWWSLQPVVATKPPQVLGKDAGHAIDAFISARQHSAGIKSGRPATARVLARRLSLVLTGLPPAPGEIEQFVRHFNRNPDAAYTALVDRLLDSQHFGEHWARHWMDVVRFAETHGYEWNHEIRDAWRYRDYLIRAFNNDVPYDQFVREHIAGDLLESPRVNERLGINESIIGTAFWRFGELGHDDCVEFPEIRFDALDNQIDTFAKAFQALTISCARCHDHKMDAISSKDYYALVGVLESCSQVVHTIDSPQRIADAVQQTQQLKIKLRQQLGKNWLAAIDQSQDAILAAISADQDDDKNFSPLKKYVANENLDWADPGYVLGRLARRDAGEDSQSLADTGDLRQAHWIWYPEGNAAADAPIATRYFRRRIVLPEDRLVTKAWCFFAGDDSVTVYVNGEFIGTANGHPSLVGVDLAGKLKAGINELAVANSNGNPEIQPNPGGWIGVVRVEFNHGDPLLLYSDSNWSCSRSANEGWQTGSFASDDWADAMELGEAGIKPWGFPWPKQSHVRREVDLASLWLKLKKEYKAEQSRRAKSNAANFEVWADFGSPDASGWSASGLGLSNGPSRAGEFTLTHEGDQVVAAVLPAGLYTNATSDRLNGSLRSPWLPTEEKFISLQLVGDRRSMVRTVVDSCALNEFAGGGLEYLTDGVPKWKRLPTSAGGSHRSFVELTTRADNPRWPDRPDRAGTKDPQRLQNRRSSFGVMRAVLHDSPTAPLPDLKLILALFEQSESADEAGVAAAFQAVARNAVIAWKDDRASDADVHWINWLLNVGLLPNVAHGDQQLGELVRQYRTVASSIPEPRVIAGLADHGSGKGFAMLQGGDPLKPGGVVPRRYLEVFAGASQPFESAGSGRRQLAEVIASSGNPLTARVMVNRVWHHLFGRGIVATTDDFGRMGDKPTHPKLLDFLAAEFRQRWLVHQETHSQNCLERNVSTVELSRQPRGSESIQETNCCITTRRGVSAPSPFVTRFLLCPAGWTARCTVPASTPIGKRKKTIESSLIGPLDGDGRRSIYTKVTRMEGPQFLELFDFPNPMATRGRRDRTNVPAQALALLNDPFVIDQAKFWAEQLVASEHASHRERVQAHVSAERLGVPPSENEQQRFVAN